MGFHFQLQLEVLLLIKRVCLTGDGGFNMNLQELQTLKNYEINNLKTFIINNHIYGITKAFQKTNFQGREEACGPRGYQPPNFYNVSKSYDIKSIIIENDDQINSKLDEALNYDGPVVVVVNCHEYHLYEPRLIGWATPIEDMYPYIDRDEFRKNMIIEPLDNWKNPYMPDVKVKIEQWSKILLTPKEKLYKKKILVAGGSGLVGTQVISILKDIDCKILSVGLETQSIFNKNVKHIKSDLRYLKNCEKITKG